MEKMYQMPLNPSLQSGHFWGAWLARSVGPVTRDLRVMSLSPMSGVENP